MDERRAVERLKGGDPGGLEALVKAHQVRAVRAAYLICRDRPLAEDVVQGAFVKAYEKIKTFDEGRPFGPWFGATPTTTCWRTRGCPASEQKVTPLAVSSSP